MHGYKQLLTYSRMSVHACTFTPSLCMTQHPATQECPPVRGPGAAAPGQVLLHWARYPDRCREPGMETGGGDMSCWGLGGSTCHRQASLHYHPPLLWRFGLRSCKTIETRFTHTHTRSWKYNGLRNDLEQERPFPGGPHPLHLHEQAEMGVRRQQAG